MKVASVLFLAVMVPLLLAGPILVDSTSASTIVNSNGNTVTTVISSNVGNVIPTIDPQARVIWDGACATTLTIQNAATIPCGYDLTYFIHTTGNALFYNGTAWSSGDRTMTLPASALTTICGTSTTSNLSCRASPCVAGSTGIAFTSYVTPASSGTVCPPGCLTCTADFANCTACLQHAYRVATPDPTTGQCLCLPSFYMEPAIKVCLACPFNLYCKTCAYNTGAQAVKCTSCNCKEHRVLNPTTNTCGCDSGYQQDGTNSYCIRV